MAYKNGVNPSTDPDYVNSTTDKNSPRSMSDMLFGAQSRIQQAFHLSAGQVAQIKTYVSEFGMTFNEALKLVQTTVDVAPDPTTPANDTDMNEILRSALGRDRGLLE